MFLDKPREGLAGSDIWRETKILSGTLYPILMRLEQVGWLDSEWEVLDPSEAGRPRKRLYRLTGLGYNKARDVMRDLGVPLGRRAWTWYGAMVLGVLASFSCAASFSMRPMRGCRESLIE